MLNSEMMQARLRAETRGYCSSSSSSKELSIEEEALESRSSHFRFRTSIDMDVEIFIDFRPLELAESPDMSMREMVLRAGDGVRNCTETELPGDQATVSSEPWDESAIDVTEQLEDAGTVLDMSAMA